jgi:hypothetical protein
MQRFEVSGAVRLIYKSLGVKGLISFQIFRPRSLFQKLCFETDYNKCGAIKYAMQRSHLNWPPLELRIL